MKKFIGEYKALRSKSETETSKDRYDTVILSAFCYKRVVISQIIIFRM